MGEVMRLERTGVVVAFDDETGEALHINEIYEEVSGRDFRARIPGKADCAAIRKIAAAKHSRRKVDVVGLSSDAAPDFEAFRGGRVFVDPSRERLVVVDGE